MHVEIKVAQNFVLNFLYNKLPRRRVNLFGEELESALRDKFADHWYPDKPFKGSAFRCLKITDPADPVLNRAARESGNPVPDIVENLPQDLAIWIDPGEVSYRIGKQSKLHPFFYYIFFLAYKIFLQSDIALRSTRIANATKNARKS